MEYYEGILFLTTNRYEDFDDAIYNRVHVTLRFEPPTPEVRGRIWRKIIQTNYQNTIPGTPHSLDSTLAIDSSSSEPVYRVLGKLEINGRTIKNLLSTAAYFAQSEKRPLGIRDLSLVLNVNLKGDPKNYPKYVKALDELKEVIEGLGGAGGT